MECAVCCESVTKMIFILKNKRDGETAKMNECTRHKSPKVSTSHERKGFEYKFVEMTWTVDLLPAVYVYCTSVLPNSSRQRIAFSNSNASHIRSFVDLYHLWNNLIFRNIYAQCIYTRTHTFVPHSKWRNRTTYTGLKTNSRDDGTVSVIVIKYTVENNGELVTLHT